MPSVAGLVEAPNLETLTGADAYAAGIETWRRAPRRRAPRRRA